MNISTDENKDNNPESPPKPVDAMVEVDISNDKLEASLNITPPKNGGLQYNFLSLRNALIDSGITYGINTEKLLSLCNSPRYNEKVIVSEGIAPVKGLDGTFDLKFNTKKDSKLVTKEDGTVDFYNLDNIENIKKDQLLCVIVPPKEGQDGMSVLGNKIPYTKGKPVPPLSGKNTYLDKDGTEIRSKIDGQVNYADGKIKVDETFYIKNNVDNSTGNINVIGNVVIAGTVIPGFMVKATGNILIERGLSSVTLIAGGDIILKSGIIASDINCEGNLNSKFIENCKACAKGTIKTDYVMNSDIKCGKNLEAINLISKIVGGKYFVGGNIKAKIIGSPANVKTYLEIGINTKIVKRRRKLEKDIEALEVQIESLKSLISILQKLEANGRLSPDQKSSLDKSLYSYNTISKSIENNKIELNELIKTIKSKSSGQVICKGILYSGTTVKIASAKKKINDTLFNKSLYYSDQKIHIKNG